MLSCTSFAGFAAFGPSRAGADPTPLGNQTIDAVTGPTRANVNESVFGAAVALSDDALVAVVGDPNAGTATVYRRATTADAWGSPTVLAHAHVANDHFGTEVALNGDGTVALVAQTDTVADAGAVIAYRYSANAWDTGHPAYVAPTSEHIGRVALDASGARAVVEHGTSTTVLTYTLGSWGITQSLAVYDVALARNGNALAYIGADGPKVAPRIGSTFDVAGASALPVGDDFEVGNGPPAISADGRTVAAIGGSLGGYEAIVWGATNAAGWYLQGRVVVPDVGLLFGKVLALDATGGRLFAGDFGYQPGDGTTSNTGRVVALQRSGATWSIAGEIASSAPHGGENFGRRVAVSADGRDALIGTYDMSNATEAAAYSWATDAAAPDPAPIARDDAVTTVREVAVHVGAVDNDGGETAVDLTGDTTSAQGGTVGWSGTVATYTPPVDFTGADSFSYTVCDHDVVPTCDTATVTVTVTPIVPFDTGVNAPALATAGVALVGDFNGGHDDVYWFRADGPDTLWVGGNAGMTATPALEMDGDYVPVSGHFAGSDRTDILWYSPTGRDVLWVSRFGGVIHRIAVPPINGRYTPVVGDFTGDGRDDVLWYAPGTSAEQLWVGGRNGFTVKPAPAIDGTYTPIVVGNGILWYAPGATREILWRGGANGFTTVRAPSVNATMTPIALRYDGDFYTDVLWYSPDGRESLWRGSANGFVTTAVRQIGAGFTPLAGDYNGDHLTDVLWHASGTSADVLWQSLGTSFRVVTPPNMTAARHALVGDFTGSTYHDDVCWYRAGSTSVCWSGRDR